MPTLSVTDGKFKLNNVPISDAYGGDSVSQTGGLSSTTVASDEVDIFEEEVLKAFTSINLLKVSSPTIPSTTSPDLV